jgi:hypothetical protein
MSTEFDLVGIQIAPGHLIHTPQCGDIRIIGHGKGPHVGELRCACCCRFCGWLSKDAACWIESWIAIHGQPLTPLPVSTETNPTRISTTNERRRRIFEVNRRIAVAGLSLKDFLLTWRPTRDWYVNQQRHRIAQLMRSYGLSVHDLVTHHELSAAAAPTTEMNAHAPEKRAENGHE